MRKACLIVIDGWGLSDPSASSSDIVSDAIAAASTPNMTYLSQHYPTVPLAAHGLSVGLPDGLMGNSEVGHLNIGAGRVVYQDIVRIDLAIQNGAMEKAPALVNCFNHAKANGDRVHFIGLVSDGGVHSHINHLFALLKYAKEVGIKECFIHFIADGRDTAPKSAAIYMKQLLEYINYRGVGKVASLTGRYYAMDRDKRWERTELAFKAYVQGEGQVFAGSPLDAIEDAYAKGTTDEFIKPIIFDMNGSIKDGDSVILFNYRSDRMRQISLSLGAVENETPFAACSKSNLPSNLSIISMTSYSAEFTFPLLSPPQTLANTLAEWLSKSKVSQCHIAETEKYAHVTFFFNGGQEKVFPGEERVLIASPKVATYDLCPEMSSSGVADAVIEAVSSSKYAFVMCNFAPPDMVGHTGNLEATIKAVSATDACIGRIYEACKANDTTLFITSDHGNAEKMRDAQTGNPHTAHTTAKVPFIICNEHLKLNASESAALCDVAPTVLRVLGMDIPVEMEGVPLVEYSNKDW